MQILDFGVHNLGAADTRTKVNNNKHFSSRTLKLNRMNLRQKSPWELLPGSELKCVRLMEARRPSRFRT